MVKQKAPEVSSSYRPNKWIAVHGTFPSERDPKLAEQLLCIRGMRKYLHQNGQERWRHTVTIKHSQYNAIQLGGNPQLPAST